MRAVQMTAVGGPEVLRVAEVPEPALTGDHDIKVRLAAAGINPVDYKIRANGLIAGSKADLAAALGAELCIDYRHEDVAAAVREWTGADGADVVHDTVGGKTFNSSFALVRPYGDLVSNAETPIGDGALELMQQHSLRVSFAWMPAPAVFGWDAQRIRQREILERVAPHFDAGELKIQVGATFPLERAADAHRALEAGQVTGKAVLTMGS